MAEKTGKSFGELFPAITIACRREGLDPETQPIPVSPAMHYHMGGLEVDGRGRTSLEGLWACGEAASTGLHGANRLASNSLLEGFVTGKWAAQDIDGMEEGRALRSFGPFERARLKKCSGDVSEEALGALLNQDAGLSRTEEGLKNLLSRTLPYAERDDGALAAAFIARSIRSARK